MDDALPAGFDGWTEELKKAWITAQVAKIQAQAQVQVAQIQAKAQADSIRSAGRVAQIQDRTAQIQREITWLRNHRSLANVNELIKPPYRETLVNVIGSICNFALDWGFDFFFATVYSEYVELPTQERLTAAY